MHTATISQLLFASWPGFAALLALFLILKVIAVLVFRDHFGEMRVLSALRGLDPGTYHHFHKLRLPKPHGHGCIQIEHVVVSPFGIFVIEARKRPSSIFGSGHEPEWLQRIQRRGKRGSHPLQVNRSMIDDLMMFLKLPDPVFYPAVVFIGSNELKDPQPGVVRHQCLIPWIRRHTVTRLDNAMVRRAVSRLNDLQESLNHEAAEKLQLHTLHVRQAV